MPIYANVGPTPPHKTSTPYVNISSSWKSVPQMWTNVNGTWKKIFGYSWETGSWGGCSVTCGGGTQTRTVRCKRNDGQYVVDATCVSQVGAKPSTSASCNTQSCYTYYWYTGGWSSCSPSCGAGSQSRTVYCRRNDGAQVSDSYCGGGKPFSSQSCNNGACNTCRYDGARPPANVCGTHDLSVTTGITDASNYPGQYSWYVNGVKVCTNTATCPPYTRSNLIDECMMYPIGSDWVSIRFYTICGPL